MNGELENRVFPRGCRLIHFPTHDDSRGCLAVGEAQQQIPFVPERVFWIYGVPEGQARGEHSHNECTEVVVPVCGAFDMLVDDGERRITIRMDSPRTGILIPPSVWCRLENFAPGTVCVVFASHPYNASGYTNDYAEYRAGIVHIVPYDNTHADEWNAFVAASKNGTFLLDRRYMDYHADRFRDCSLLFYKKGELIAALPANWEEEERAVCSHGGLTYGGLILSSHITAVEALEVFSCAMDWFQNTLGAARWVYKPMPYIYHRLPAEEDLYALFRLGATLHSRAISSVVDLKDRLPMRELRRRGVKKALGAGVTCTESTDFTAFWPILAEVLQTKHGRTPVHTLDEMLLLHERFPENIRLFLALGSDGNPLAGTVVYETERVAHAQYIAASAEGKALGALDCLFDWLITERYADKAYFDFGISTEQGGTWLNEGLLFQKEGFGARAVVYDAYEIRF
jgi:WxcM-like, C-terminal.